MASVRSTQHSVAMSERMESSTRIDQSTQELKDCRVQMSLQIEGCKTTTIATTHYSGAYIEQINRTTDTQSYRYYLGIDIGDTVERDESSSYSKAMAQCRVDVRSSGYGSWSKYSRARKLSMKMGLQRERGHFRVEAPRYKVRLVERVLVDCHIMSRF